MPKTSVFAPLLDDGVPSINFFNGRLLSAEDLKTEGKANREAHRRLAHGIGDGVVSGLEVRMAEPSTADDPAVMVTAGVAIARTGDAIQLPADTRVSLLTVTAALGTTELTPFKYCTPPRAGAYVAGAGVYLLAITSTFAGKGRAPSAGLGNQITNCNTKYIIEGVEFVLMPIAADSLLSDPDTLRNRLAYACFGVGADAALAADLFGATAGGDPVSALRNAGTLTDCDVPLAIVYWTSSGVQFVDMWSVRRRPAIPGAGGVGEFIDPQHIPIAEARLMQFQAQLAEAVERSPDLSALDARANFRFLPPAGVLPMRAPAGAAGVNEIKFFDGRPRRHPVFIDAAVLPKLVHDSLAYAPIDVRDQEMVWTYVVRQNFDTKTGGDLRHKYVVFTSGHMPYYGHARFDVSRWNYSNYSSALLGSALL